MELFKFYNHVECKQHEFIEVVQTTTSDGKKINERKWLQCKNCAKTIDYPRQNIDSFIYENGKTKSPYPLQVNECRVDFGKPLSGEMMDSLNKTMERLRSDTPTKL